MRSQRSIGLVVFDTVFGRARITWSERGLTSVNLLEPDRSEGNKKDASLAPTRFDAAPPAWVEDAIASITRHLCGDVQDLKGVPVDMESNTPFYQRVYEALRSVDAGKTVSYAELAELAGSPRAVRAVGQALARNPLCIVIPCHRVLATGGKPGGFSAPGGVTTKLRLLELEKKSRIV